MLSPRAIPTRWWRGLAGDAANDTVDDADPVDDNEDAGSFQNAVLPSARKTGVGGGAMKMVVQGTDAGFRGRTCPSWVTVPSGDSVRRWRRPPEALSAWNRRLAASYRAVLCRRISITVFPR